MTRTLRDGDWNLLIRRIRNGQCTPFLGAGACAGVLPLANEIAREWARDFQFPLSASPNLINVAQFLAVEYDARFPKELMKERCESVLPNFNRADEIHRVLASLPLPMYITTNYDPFMKEALLRNKLVEKKPEQEICRWNDRVKAYPSIFDREPDFVASSTRPIVFHFHGHVESIDSMVLTEDDYLDFLINIGREPDSLKRIEQAFTETSLLFIGYSLTDWNFKVVFRSLVSYLKRNYNQAHISVQLLEEEYRNKDKALEFLDKLFRDLYNVTVYWGSCDDFAADLIRRM